jgi:hypothetical protein
MIQENIAERLEIEKEIRQSIQQNPRLSTLPSSSVLPRSNFQQNLAEQDGERGSILSRSIVSRPSQSVQSQNSSNSTVYNPQHLVAAVETDPKNTPPSTFDIEDSNGKPEEDEKSD